MGEGRQFSGGAEYDDHRKAVELGREIEVGARGKGNSCLCVKFDLY